MSVLKFLAANLKWFWLTCDIQHPFMLHLYLYVSEGNELNKVLLNCWHHLLLLTSHDLMNYPNYEICDPFIVSWWVTEEEFVLAEMCKNTLWNAGLCCSSVAANKL
jgi:hypothetical protein